MNPEITNSTGKDVSVPRLGPDEDSALKLRLFRAFRVARRLVPLLALLPVLAFVPTARAASDTVHAGYRSLVGWLPGPDIRLDVAVWYPTQSRPTTIKAGSWTFSAARNAPPLPGLWPLLVLSPDSSGSRFAHHDLAASLARRGFIVAVPTHDGDNADDMRFLYTDRHLPTRARQLSATLDLVLRDPQLGSTLDKRRIGLVGFGGGSSAGLLLAGATLTPDLWDGYCASSGGDGRPDPYCEPYMAARIDEITRGMRRQTAAVADAAARRAEAEAARDDIVTRARDGVTKTAARLRRAQRKPVTDFPTPPAFVPLLPPLPPDRPLADSRFRAMMLISPGYSMLFAPDTLKSLPLPLFIVGLERDPLHTPERQALVLRSLLAPPTPEYALLTGADGPALQALCPPDMERDLPDLCRTVSPDEREALHHRLETLILDFFRHTPA